jgi:hypothetical protein
VPGICRRYYESDAKRTASSGCGGDSGGGQPSRRHYIPAKKMIDPGATETTAIADVNKDGLPDIISGDSWYEAPLWKKHHIRDIDFTNNYVDNFSDLVVDVDGDGYPDIVQFGYFSGNIVWLRNPGKNVASPSVKGG